MEYEVNQVFERDGKRYQCVVGACEECAFNVNVKCIAWDLSCNGMARKDGTDVRFAEVSK